MLEPYSNWSKRNRDELGSDFMLCNYEYFANWSSHLAETLSYRVNLVRNQNQQRFKSMNLSRLL
jgi:hypothetical protein